MADQFQGKYHFSLKTELLPGVGVDFGPRGMRAHVGYEVERSEVETDEKKYANAWGEQILAGTKKSYSIEQARKLATERKKELPYWLGLTGKVASGGDFLLLRTDGVIEMDGRVTLRAEDGALIDAVYRGVTDLRALADSKDKLTGKQVYEQFRLGTFKFRKDKDTKGTLPLFLSVWFETASSPEATGDDSDMSWVRDRYRATGLHYWRYEPLVRGSFVARGTLMLDDPTRDKPISEGPIALDVYQLVSP